MGAAGAAGAEAQAAAAAARLGLEATRLRAEVAELELASATSRRAKLAQRLLSLGGADEREGEGVARSSLTADELRERLEALVELEVSEEGLKRLFLVCERDVSSGALAFEDLTSARFGTTLDELVSADRAEKRRQLWEDNAKVKQEAEEMRSVQPLNADVLAMANDDRGVWTRLFACLVYFLPLTDGLQFGFPLVEMFPDLAPLFLLLAVPSAIIGTIPFGSLICFVGLTVCANNRELPRLLRFNAQQAVLLDVFLFIPSIFFSLVSTLFGAGVGDIVEDLGYVSFVVLLAAVTYSVVSTAFGQDPDALPVVSDATKRGIDRPPF
mmetsp:Transcript_104122/g.299310  ORF Transcript_104122/g.299310 Transcript_104122/m.299310 type:complete len:326 (+) Transcript_104122:1943-2920(+)